MGAGTSEIAKATGLTRQTVIRIGKDPVKADQTLKQWEPQGYDMQKKMLGIERFFRNTVSRIE